MSLLPKAVPAPAPRSQNGVFVATIYAALLVLILIAQLFTFDDFIEIIPSLGLPFDAGLLYALTSILVVSELFALPFLLRMAVGPAFRWLSMVCGWVVALGWLAIAIRTMSMDASVATIGLLGSVVDIPPGWGALGISLLLVGVTCYVSWALWPVTHRRTARPKNS